MSYFLNVLMEAGDVTMPHFLLIKANSVVIAQCCGERETTVLQKGHLIITAIDGINTVDQTLGFIFKILKITLASLYWMEAR